MKNLSLVLNAVLVVAVAVLFYLHFKSPTKAAPKSISGSSAKMNIAYVNTDTLLEHYDFFVKTRNDLKAQEEKTTNSLTAQAAALQKEYESAQARVSSMTATEAQNVQESLQRKQQELMQRREQLSDDYSKKLQDMNDMLTNRIHDYLKNYNKEKQFDYILGYQKGSGILLAKDELDITPEVLNGMNDDYKKEKK